MASAGLRGLLPRMVTGCLLVIFTLMSQAAHVEADCGQNSAGATLPNRKIAAAETTSVTIDYAVFYTPEARTSAGDEAAIRTKIETAFAGANDLFALSGSDVRHRVVHLEELPVNNVSQTLPDLNTELAHRFNFFTVLDAVKADTSVIIVNFQTPGGYANIPLTPGQAGRGGTINLGLPNVSANVLAHEIGHTLGAGHDFPETAGSFFIPPTYTYGNHFIGVGTGGCYRTIMSARTTCRVAGFSGDPATPCHRFANPNLLFDGSPTGDPVNADTVRLFAEFAPFVASTRGAAAPINPPDGDDGDGGTERPAPSPSPTSIPDTLTLQLRRRGSEITAQGSCLTVLQTPLTGDRIELRSADQGGEFRRRVGATTCSAEGKYRIKLRRGGTLRARNTRTGTESRNRRI